MFYGKRFFEVYCNSWSKSKLIVDIGAQDVNGSLRSVSPTAARYVGVDFVEGKGVDVILDDPYRLPFETDSVDAIVCSSCFEHSQFFWLVFLEILRVLKPSGLLYLNAPSNGFVHKYPVDCWRFYPDAGHAMVEWGRRNGYKPALLESFVGGRSQGKVSEGGMWNDFVAVFVKDEDCKTLYAERVVHSLSDYSNGYSSERVGVLRENGLGPDFQLIESQVRQHDVLNAALAAASAERDAKVSELAAARQELVDMHQSISWRITAPLRAFADRLRRAATPGDACGIVSKVAMAVCTLPATFFHYRGAGAWLGAARNPTTFFGDVLRQPGQIVQAMQGRRSLLRKSVFSSFATATLIRESGGILPASLQARRIFRREGGQGLKAWMLGTLAPELVVAPAGRSSRAPSPSRILVMDYRVPRADVSAGERATLGLLKDLRALGYDVVFLPRDMQGPERYVAPLRELGVDVVTTESGYQWPEHYLRVHAHSFGAFYLIRVDVAESALDILERAAPLARIVFHAPDLYFLREGRAAELSGDPVAQAGAERTRERELAVMRRVHQIVVVSPAEVPVLQAYLPDASITVFPALYADVVNAPPPFDARQHVFFLGGFGHAPNTDAVAWFVREVWPQARERLPGVEFHIIGADAPPEIMALASEPGVRVRGFVADLGPILAGMRVGVAPLRYGAGVKGKVAMTLGAGVPCVCTPVAAEGMGIVEGVHARISADAQGFADALVDLYGDEVAWRRISAGGRALVERCFGELANREGFLNVLQQARILPLALFGEYCSRMEVGPVPDPQGAVDVSVIIPVYNKWHLTRACINSILATCTHANVSFELILADDGSQDETRRAAEFYPGLRVARTPENVGFLRNCNHAARQARGNYLLLLNNDTLVLPGWLERLYATAEQDPRVAIVGSKLLYPDGTVQEAGGMLFKDASGFSTGRGLVATTPILNVAHEVDYISGASILIRGSFWKAVGGFDERYKNAYCEDSDLAMTARARGMRVVYEPASEVVHLEHQSYADQSSAHNDKALQNHNTALLLDKWRTVLERDHWEENEFRAGYDKVRAHLDVAALPALFAHRFPGVTDVLCLSPVPVYDAVRDGTRRIYDAARSLQRIGCRVHFALAGACTEQEARIMGVAWDAFVLLSQDARLAAEQVREYCARQRFAAVLVFVPASELVQAVPGDIPMLIEGTEGEAPAYGRAVSSIPADLRPPRFRPRRNGRIGKAGVFLADGDVQAAVARCLKVLPDDDEHERQNERVLCLFRASHSESVVPVVDSHIGCWKITWADIADEVMVADMDLILACDGVTGRWARAASAAAIAGVPVLEIPVGSAPGERLDNVSLHALEEACRSHYLTTHERSMERAGHLVGIDRPCVAVGTDPH